ncbi:MAG: cellobiose phosphorylase [Lachnospiraceae bacterium]|nr:cellobiose phosphorylase [Lachnospiraceae bacterium]MDD3614766.1 cellobiose phosphorylase [Lachnospiraceae bacterium]
MPEVSIDLDMKRITNDAFVKIARECEPDLLEKTVRPEKIVTIELDQDKNPVITRERPINELSEIEMKKGDRVCLDFGHHQVGYVTLRLKSVGSPQDAPAFFKLKFGEIARELTENSEDYNGWISRGWIQEEFMHVDVLPATIVLPRRYAFRYLEITTIDTSMKWQLVVEEVTCKSVSAVDMDKVEPYATEDEMIKQLDAASLRTLQNCMQSVFEDGPKRDRRLWLGDLRLQALANYETFKNYDLVKRCLYLFAGLTRDDGKIGACLFIEPEYIVDDTFLFDYSLFFVASLYDYYIETKDMDTVKDLWPSALRQIELANEYFDEKMLVVIPEGFTCFIDWTEGLDKQASAQAVYLYCVKRGLELAKVLGDDENEAWLTGQITEKQDAAKKWLWDEKQELFVSGSQKQISYASQVWMILADIFNKEENKKLLNHIIDLDPEKGMVSPYMNHHFVEALILCDEKEKAMDYMKYYWGGMIREGADTFWELYNPKNPGESPYGSSIVNSYCHAWSCTPTYLLRKYFK